MNVQVAVDCSGHEDGQHRPERLALSIKIIGGDGLQKLLICVSREFLKQNKNGILRKKWTI